MELIKVKRYIENFKERVKLQNEQNEEISSFNLNLANFDKENEQGNDYTHNHIHGHGLNNSKMTFKAQINNMVRQSLKRQHRRNSSMPELRELDLGRKQEPDVHLNLTFKKVASILNQASEIESDSNTVFYLKTLRNLEEKENDISVEMAKMREREIKRILREYNANNYERRYKVVKEVVISALVGEDNLMEVINLDKREMNKLQEKTSKLKIFNLMGESTDKSIKTREREKQRVNLSNSTVLQDLMNISSYVA